MARLKIATRQLFSEKVRQAFLKYQELSKGKGAKLKEESKQAFAIRAAHDLGLGYIDGEVEPKIVSAILVLANRKASEEERANALLQAWKDYDRNFRTLH